MPTKVNGQGGDDVLYGGVDDDVLRGGDGNDRIVGAFGNDSLAGGDGNDTLLGGRGNDTLLGQAGDDYIAGHFDQNEIRGGEGNDRLLGGSDADFISGNGGNDTIFGFDGDDSLVGSVGNDEIFGGAGNDFISGPFGDDVLSGNGGNDSILGGDGDDILKGNDGDDTLFGGVGVDRLEGGDGNDLVGGGVDDDADILLSGTGMDQFYGDVVGDFIFIGSTNDSFLDSDFDRDFDTLIGREVDSDISVSSVDQLVSLFGPDLQGTVSGTGFQNGISELGLTAAVGSNTVLTNGKTRLVFETNGDKTSLVGSFSSDLSEDFAELFSSIPTENASTHIVADGSGNLTVLSVSSIGEVSRIGFAEETLINFDPDISGPGISLSPNPASSGTLTPSELNGHLVGTSDILAQRLVDTLNDKAFIDVSARRTTPLVFVRFFLFGRSSTGAWGFGSANGWATLIPTGLR